MPARKRGFEEVDITPENSGNAPLLHRLRNMWQFANLCQWIYIFGKAAKIDESLDVEEIETECLKPSSPTLDDIALALLKLISSHRGLTHEIFDDQCRKQYLNRAPTRNPFGDDEVANRFADFDVETKIRVLQQLTQWIMCYPERLRERADEQKDSEQTSWRIEPYGWDADDRTYYVLDDNRVYRLTDAPPAPPPTKTARPSKKTKSFRSGTRRSGRHLRESTPLPEPDSDNEPDSHQAQSLEGDEDLGGMVWECIAVTLHDVNQFLESIRRSRDDNEKILRRQLEDHLVPILEKQEESRKRREAQRERELLSLAKMANAKRSSRIAGRRERQEEEDKAREEERQRRVTEASTRKAEQKRLKLEQERDFRMLSRGNRLKEREARRLQHEEELAQLSEASKATGTGNERLSERRLQAEIERNKQALQDLDDEEEDWVFDCVCGLYGQVDDGTHSVACEKCNIWQHSKCLGIEEADAERPDFHFLCTSCRRREAEAHPRPSIKLKLNRPNSAGSQAAPGGQSRSSTPRPQSSLVVELPVVKPAEGTILSDLVPKSGHHQVVNYTSRQTNGTNQQSAQRGEPGTVGNGIPSGATKTFEELAKPKVNLIDAAAPPSSLQNSSRDAESAPRKEDRQSFSSDEPQSSPPRVASTPSSVRKLRDGEQTELSMNSPHISHQIHSSAQNGAVPLRTDHSPTKHSPEPQNSPSPGKVNPTVSITSSIPTLSPTRRDQILTPPVKPSWPVAPASGDGQSKYLGSSFETLPQD